MLLAVLLLGVPLAVAGVFLVAGQAERSAQDRADTLARQVERRIATGLEVDDDLLQPYTNAERDWPAQVRVVMPRQEGAQVGEVRTAGDDAGPGAVAGRATTADANAATATGTDLSGAAQVEVLVPRDEVRAVALQIVLLVVAVAAVAVAAAVGLALVQARRLSAPLVELARSAERLGAGQLRPRAPDSGIEEVDLVAEEIARSAERTAARLAAEREFASDASHQLRTPLTAVSMRLEEIASASDSPDVTDEARIALDQVERLVTVVDDLLARARSHPDGPVGPVTLRDVLAQQQEEWEPAYAAVGRDVAVDAPAGLRAVARPGPLAQVLATLLENSLRHGAGTTTVRARRSGPSVVIEVSDAGPGVPDELGTRVFERRVSGASSTGLGLALARDLVAAEGGRLELLRRRPPVFAVFVSAG